MTPQEFEHIYSSVRSQLVSLAERFCRSTSVDLDAEDIVQEALTAFWELSENGYSISNANALLVRITKNICITRYRKRKLKTEPIMEEGYLSGDSASSGTDRMDEMIIRQRLYECLTKTERKYMLLKSEEGLSLDEMVKETGGSKPGIKTALSKARRKLEEQFKKMGYGK